MLVRVVAASAALVVTLGACSSSAAHKPSSSPSPTTSAVAAPATTSTPATTAAPSSSSAKPSPTARSTTPSAHPPAHQATPSVTHQAAGTTKLPLRATTGNSTQVITVVAPSTSSTTATLQAWTKAGSGWKKHGSSMVAHLGSDGLSAHPSETKSATPIGSFTLTQAFGHDRDPGTALPYLHTTSADWWISQSGPLYNTHQRCSSNCPFDNSLKKSNKNEHLYYETPFYNYAVVIDYNTRNAPGGVTAGAGSAFFLHVTDGNPTAGCVSIPQADLVSILRWLEPGDHPRILIGT